MDLFDSVTVNDDDQRAQEFFTISELNRLIKDVINSGFPRVVWVCGEIQGYDRNKNKSHIFFDLVEKDKDSKDIIAKIGLVIFSQKKAQISAILKKSENAFELKDDIEVKFACRVDFYAPHGAVRLIIEGIDPVYTLGKLAQERQRLIALLREKGVLDKNKQWPLSSVPLHLGLITADDSAAYNDFLSELEKSRFGFKLYLRDCLMQGKRAQDDICQAMDELTRMTSLDAIVITRGGGSIADLSCFDSESIARKIAESPLPVLSGIGHEINTTITDLAAHTYAKTPTAIAQFLVQRVQGFLDELDEKIRMIFEGATDGIEGQKQKLRSQAIDLQANTQHYLKRHHEHILRLTQVIGTRPPVFLKESRQLIDRQQENLKKSVKLYLQDERSRAQHFKKIIDVLDPVNTLRRGFSITRTQDGKVLKNISQVKLDAQLKTELFRGFVESQVTHISKEP